VQQFVPIAQVKKPLKLVVADESKKLQAMKLGLLTSMTQLFGLQVILGDDNIETLSAYTLFSKMFNMV